MQSLIENTEETKGDIEMSWIEWSPYKGVFPTNKMKSKFSF